MGSTLLNLKKGVATLSDLADGGAAYGVPSGKAYWLDTTNGNDNNDGSIEAPFKTLAYAYAALRTGYGDTLYYVASSTAAGSAGSVSLTETFTWSKNNTSLIGVTAETPVSPRARIVQASTATGVSPMFNVTGFGNRFENIQWFQGVADATSLIDVQVTGDRNAFTNCHFAGGGNATQAVDGGASLKLNGAEECVFNNCTIGVDTIAAATGMTALTFDGSSARNIFNNCRLELLAGNSGAVLVELVDATSVDRWNEFNWCSFFANSVNKATTIASAFVIPNGHTTTATIFINYPKSSLGFTDWDADDRGILYINTGTITGGGNAGYSVVSASA
jgi:hypothetical protein